MIAPKPIRTELGRTSREAAQPNTPGTYLAKVVSHLDQRFMGALRVQLIKTRSSADDDSDPGQIVDAFYASPFFGTTPLTGATGPNDYTHTQQSYGFWAVPPDPGSRVLVTFVEGRHDYCFWFACVPDEYMNFTVPAGNTATAVTDPTMTPATLLGKKLPVGEYNKNRVDPQGQKQPTYYPKPPNDRITDQLFKAGLLDDDTRGLTTSGARREAPSNVYGMNTPGPLYKGPGAPRVDKGVAGATASMFSSRIGGHSIVMDDGDEKILRRGPARETPSEYVPLEQNEGGGNYEIPANELFRIRTRTGHQILLHNSEDLIYIGNAGGTAWIELTANGKIDIYSHDSVSIHSENDLNFVADRDINLTAYEDMNIIVGKELRMDAGDQVGLTSGAKIAANAEEGISLSAGTFLAGYAPDNVSFISQNTADFLAESTVNIGSAGGEVAIEGCQYVKIATDGDFHTKALGTIFMQSDEAGINMLAKLSAKITAENTVEIKSTDAAMKLYSKSIMSLKADGANIQATGSKIHLNTAGSPASVASDAQPATLPSVPDPALPESPARAKQAARQPMHEPWYQHENLNPMEYTPEKTRAGEQQIDTFVDAIPDTYLPPQNQPSVGRTQSQQRPQQDFAGPPGAYTDPNANVPRAQGGTPAEPLTAAPGRIPGFTEQETLIYLNALGQRESGNSYDVVNSICFAGKYQFGHAALEDMGYIRSGTFARGLRNCTVMRDSSFWTGRDGISSLQDWLGSPDVQEATIIRYTTQNLNTLRRIGALREGDSVSVISGLLMAAHLKGPGDVRDWRNGNSVNPDAYGTTVQAYYNLGRSTISNETVWSA